MNKISSLLFFLLFTVSLSAQDVTFQVDMRGVTFSGAVFIAGDQIDNWYGTFVYMEDPDGDSIYTKTLKLKPGPLQYKYMWDSWANVEDLDAAPDGSYCTLSTDGNTNRYMVVGTNDTVLAPDCFGQCQACSSTGAPANVDVTFRVDMSSAAVSSAYLTGGELDSWCTSCIAMTDPDGDQIYEKVMNLAPGTYEYKFVRNGTLESFGPGGPCTVTNFGFHNRLVHVPLNGPSAITLEVFPFNGCNARMTNLTLRVDMTGQVVDPAGVHLAGSFNGWDHSSHPMEDIGNNLWEILISVPEGTEVQYKFVNGNTTLQEETVPSSCSDPYPDGFENRYWVAGSGNQILNTSCYGACGACVDTLNLVWADEFSGSALDATKWTPEIGNGVWGWGNNELEYYTSNPGNVDVIGGELIITAKEESFGGFDYTSARLITKNKADFTYGRFEAMIDLPTGQGIWPAFWLLSTDNVYGGWPTSGEIDIMEMVGHNPFEVHSTLHYGPEPGSGHRYTGTGYAPGVNFSSGYHLYAVEWEENQLRWYVDSVQIYELNRRDLCPWDWPFDQDFFIIMNCAVGGLWPGAPNASTVFPQEMKVDYVRVYQNVPVGIEDPIENSPRLSLFPNPTQSAIFLEAPGLSVATVKVLDAQGKELLKKERFNLMHELNVEQLPAGLYFIQATQGTKSFTGRFIRE